MLKKKLERIILKGDKRIGLVMWWEEYMLCVENNVYKRLIKAVKKQLKS